MEEQKELNVQEEQKEQKFGLDDEYTENEDKNTQNEKKIKKKNEKKEKKSKKVTVQSLRLFGLFFFLLGILTSAVIILLCTCVFKLGVIVSNDSYEEYQAIKDEYGKYYKMEQLFNKSALYKYSKPDIDTAICDTLVSGLDDKYARYYTKEEFDNIVKQYFDTYSGIGIAIVSKDGHYVVSRVFSGGPAEKAGVKANDIIVKVDGKEVTEDDDIVKMIEGENGTKISISVKRGNKNLEFEMYRAEIQEDSVEYKVYDKSAGIGYIQVKSFREGTTKEFKLAVKSLKNDGCDKFIIDLRQNSGGVETEGIDLADELLPSCRIISEKNNKNKEKIYNSDQSQSVKNYVILVDGYTASASEIVSAAVQGNGGILIGSKTYGKGLVQSVISFKDGSAVKFTTAEYFGPDGTKINGIGLTPNIITSKPMSAAVKELSK